MARAWQAIIGLGIGTELTIKVLELEQKLRSRKSARVYVHSFMFYLVEQKIFAKIWTENLVVLSPLKSEFICLLFLMTAHWIENQIKAKQSNCDWSKKFIPPKSC